MIWNYFALSLLALAAPQSCREASDSLVRFLAALPHSCARNEDCEAYSLMGACDPPTALPKAEYNKVDQAKLSNLQAQKQKACPVPAVACAPSPLKAKCVKKNCVLK